MKRNSQETDEETHGLRDLPSIINQYGGPCTVHTVLCITRPPNDCLSLRQLSIGLGGRRTIAALREKLYNLTHSIHDSIHPLDSRQSPGMFSAYDHCWDQQLMLSSGHPVQLGVVTFARCAATYTMRHLKFAFQGGMTYIDLRRGCNHYRLLHFYEFWLYLAFSQTFSRVDGFG